MAKRKTPPKTSYDLEQSQLPTILRSSIPIDESAGPGGIMSVLAKIENDLATMQRTHAELKGMKKRLDKFIETFTATLIDLVSDTQANTITGKKEYAKAILHDTPEYRMYLTVVGDLAELDTDFEYLDIRRSIGQSVLKSMEQDHAKFGKGAS